MSTLEPKPVIKKPLNSRMLTIAAILLVVLALLFLATPLLRINGNLQGRGNFTGRTFNGQTLPNGGTGGTGGNGFQFQDGSGTGGTGNNGNGQTFPNGFQGQNGTGTTRQFGAGAGLLRVGFLNGVIGTIVYAMLLLVSIAAAAGMLFTKRWGKILGIIMGVVYLVLGLVGLVPTLLTLFFGLRNPLTIILGILHLVLSLAVIVFASIPAKQPAAPMMETPPLAAA
jgi:hypothetical protein